MLKDRDNKLEQRHDDERSSGGGGSSERKPAQKSGVEKGAMDQAPEKVSRTERIERLKKEKESKK